MFVAELKGRVGLMRLARWQMIAGFLMSGTAATFLSGWSSVTRETFVLLCASGVFGIVLASSTYFASIYMAGPRIAALLFSLTSPFALALGYVVLGETISLPQGIGVVLVLAGIVLAVSPPLGMLFRGRDTGTTARLPWAGIGFGVVTALGQAMGNLLARPAMAAGVEPFTAMAIRSGLAAGVFLLVAAFPFARTDTSPPTLRNIGLAATASLFGTVLGMSLLMAALGTGDVGLISTLAAVSPVAILPMVWLRTGVAPGLGAWIGAVLAIAGTGFISLG